MIRWLRFRVTREIVCAGVEVTRRRQPCANEPVRVFFYLSSIPYDFDRVIHVLRFLINYRDN